jgi:hypothetical protein
MLLLQISPKTHASSPNSHTSPISKYLSFSSTTNASHDVVVMEHEKSAIL